MSQTFPNINIYTDLPRLPWHSPALGSGSGSVRSAVQSQRLKNWGRDTQWHSAVFIRLLPVGSYLVLLRQFVRLNSCA